MSATIIVNNDTCSGEYDMFDVRSLDESGAVLSGPLFLEVGETLQLRLSKGEQIIEIQAKVQSVTRDEESMTVLFVDLEESKKALIRGTAPKAALKSSAGDTDVSPAPTRTPAGKSGKRNR